MMGEVDINTLTMEQYMALTHGNHAPGVVKPKIRGNVNFKIKSQFMRELREYTFLGNKNDDAHEHVEKVLDISCEEMGGQIIPKNHQHLGLAQKSLYLKAWERFNDLLYKFPTHDLNSHQKVNIFYKGLDTMTRQSLDSQGPITKKTPTQAWTAIQTMADHLEKWYNRSSSRKISSSGNFDGFAAIASKLEGLGRDMKKLKENVYATQVGCQTCGGAHLDKECPLNEEVNSVEEVKYGEFGKSFPNSGGNGAKFRVGPSGYYTRVDNRPPFREKRPRLEEILNKHLEEST
ncbi:hypothetical protein Tco_1102544 [Tanacetum coccineum]